MQTDKVGRAYIRAWYASGRAPLPGGRLRVWHRFLCCWCLQYLFTRPVPEHMPWGLKRRHARIWVDAAGETLCLAAVLWLGGRFWTRWRCVNRQPGFRFFPLIHRRGTAMFLLLCTHSEAGSFWCACLCTHSQAGSCDLPLALRSCSHGPVTPIRPLVNPTRSSPPVNECKAKEAPEALSP